MLVEEKNGTARTWVIRAVLITLAVYFYVFMEWLFFVTKPSFMSTWSLFGRLSVLWATPGPFAAAGIVLVALCLILTRLIKGRPARAICLIIVRLVTAVVLAAALLLLADNFTYTLFGFGIRSATGFLRIVYLIILLLFGILSYRFLGGFQKTLERPSALRVSAVAALVMIAISAAAVLFGALSGDRIGDGGIEYARSFEDRPYIILLSSDGLNADHMSVYGYHRKTTPFIDKMAKRAFICENCFANAGTSGASITSMLTGKLPTETGLIYPPDILTGVDAYQHLPGILRHRGYRNVDISIRHHSDPEDLNLLNSFHWANERSLEDEHGERFLGSILSEESIYFLRIMRGRVVERFLHITGRRSMEDPLGEVIRTEQVSYGRDLERIHAFNKCIQEASQPLFVHMHLLGTHGPTFKTTRHVFSRGARQDRPWMTDFYDDAVLAFDSHVKSIVGHLEKRRLLDKSVIVICTDHGQNFTVHNRLPLIFLFPRGRYGRRMTANAQYIDIAPTLLDYLGIEQPDWMSGRSLIARKIEPDRFIFSADPKASLEFEQGLEAVPDRDKPGPPFYSLKALGVHCCHKYFELDLENGILTVSVVAGHTAPCDEADMPDPRVVGRAMIDHLDTNGYDTSSIARPLRMRASR